MATLSVVTTICDNCGAREQRTIDHDKDGGWRNTLSSLNSYSGVEVKGGTRNDYCPACVKAVDDAIAAALDARKQAAAEGNNLVDSVDARGAR